MLNNLLLVVKHIEWNVFLFFLVLVGLKKLLWVKALRSACFRLLWVGSAKILGSWLLALSN